MEENARIQDLQEDINYLLSKGVQVGSLSDGHHSFDALYEARNSLYISLAKALAGNIGRSVWCSTIYSNDTPVQDGWFLLGINTKPGTQITFHLPAKHWEVVSAFAQVKRRAPEFDGHTPAEVLERIAKL